MGVSAQGSLLGLNYDSTYDLWDPQHWMLDGLIDFNYPLNPPVESV